MTITRLLRPLAVGIALVLTFAVGCSSDSEPDAAAPPDDTAGIRLVDPSEGASIQADPPEDLVIVDVRTPEEFVEGHLDGAIMIDFYSDDFTDQLSTLDPDVPYLLYCRSGNRSGQTATILNDLGFSDVADIDGGITAWQAAGNPVVIE